MGIAGERGGGLPSQVIGFGVAMPAAMVVK